MLRYQRSRLEALVDSINASGYGLTFGVHTRLDETVRYVTDRIRAGNIYVNRNIVGAVVGVQPFGGEGLSGTGPKAGGGLPVQGPVGGQAGVITLPGPTGESNTYHLKPRGTVLCLAHTEHGIRAQHEACRRTGNRMLIIDTPAGKAFHEAGEATEARLAAAEDIANSDFQAVLFEGDGDELRALNQEVARRDGPSVPVQGLGRDELAAGARYAMETLVREVSLSINTAAAGGNASLMMIG